MTKTTIEVSIQTRDQLKSIGRKGETYDQIIQRLLMVFEKVRRQRLDEITQKLNHRRMASARRGMET